MVMGCICKMNKSILITTAVEAEQEAVLLGLTQPHPFQVEVVGVGPMTAAAHTATLLAKSPYQYVINMGIAGGFVEQEKIPSIVVATEMVAVELGAETESGFCFVDELGFGSARIQSDPKLVKRVMHRLEMSASPVITGPILTVSTVTGTVATAKERANRVPGAVAEAMEGFGVASAAKMSGLPVIEIRTLSNVVGPRDRSAWRIKEALDALTTVSKELVEVFK